MRRDRDLTYAERQMSEFMGELSRLHVRMRKVAEQTVLERHQEEVNKEVQRLKDELMRSF